MYAGSMVSYMGGNVPWDMSHKFFPKICPKMSQKFKLFIIRKTNRNLKLIYSIEREKKSHLNNLKFTK